MRNNSYKFILEKQEHKTNQLINSSSPYLRQHANNPVNWLEWSETAFEQAKNENKLVIVSIGYSACHWCHVMAHECFEDEETAKLMNERFICIKVDREELPDVDQTYMDACQLINGNGGWPLNALTLPDKHPIHALTYAPKKQWQKTLDTISSLWLNVPNEVLDYAAKLEKGLHSMSLAPAMANNENKESLSALMLQAFSERYDASFGGFGKAPKFPMPNNLAFLFNIYQYTQDNNAKNMLLHTLDSMSLGGLYDHVGGGFARYSVDERWFAPHFEKMLYDNAQLIELYAASAWYFDNPVHKKTALNTIQFCNNELKNDYGLMASALDADSDGEEGLFYTYTYAELEEALGKDTVFFSQYFQCRQAGNWEHNRNILYAIDTIQKASAQFEIDEQMFENQIDNCLKKLKSYREKRNRPGLDDKCICSWNSLYLKGISEASFYLKDTHLLESAQNLADKILELFESQSDLKRIFAKGRASIPAYLEDYACLIDALISLYKACRKEHYLLTAMTLTETVLEKFYDTNIGFFRFNSGTAVLHHKYDTSDDVINSGNSIMARNLNNLSWYFDRTDLREISDNMLAAMRDKFKENAPWYSNWAALQLRKEFGFEQLVVAANDNLRSFAAPEEFKWKFDALIAFTSGQSALPLLKHKPFQEQSLLYVCKDMTCQNPVNIELKPL